MNDLRQRVRFQPAPPRVEPRRRRWLVFAGLGLLALVVLLALAYRPAAAARSQLEFGRQAMQRAQEQLLAGEAAPAGRSFREAQASFERALGLTRTPLLRLAGWVPVLRRTPSTVAAIAEAGERVARAGTTIADSVGGLPGGMEALSPDGGRLDPEPFADLAPAVGRSERLVAEALQRVRSTPGSLLLGPVSSARAETLAELSSLRSQLGVAARLFERLPAFLGSEAPARYFVGAQNPAEARGTGGLIGAYSILRIDEGRFRFGRFRPVQSLPDFAPHQVEPPSDEYAEHYDRFGGAGFWLNMNMTPDFPSAAEAIRTTYRKATGVALDGVIVADPFALRELMEVTGAVEVPGIRSELSPEEVVPFLTNEAYAQIADSETRKAVLGTVAQEVFDRFIEGRGARTEWLRAVAEATRGGHLLVNSADGRLQQELTRTGVAGAFRAPSGDFLSVIQNNGGGNKLDYYLDRRVLHRVELRPDGSAAATTRVTLENGAPEAGLPRYVMGPYPGISEAGENVSFLNLYCAATCAITRVREDGRPVDDDAYHGEELGHPFAQHYLGIDSGESAEVEFDSEIEAAWNGDFFGGVYRLWFLNQPTARPTRLRVEVRLPPGMVVTTADPDVRAEGGVLVWEGTPGPREPLRIAFEKPASRLWEGTMELLGRRVVRL